MTITLNDKETLKAVLLELLKEDKEFCQAVAKEIGVGNGNEAQMKRREEVIESIDEDFKKYENVFKKLA